MKIVDIIEHEIKQYIESKRPPQEIRNQVDLGYLYKNKVAEIIEIRPQWNDASIINNRYIAKAKYVKTQNIWKIFWMRSNGKWVSYQPMPEVKNITEFLEVLENDKTGCFWG